MARYCPDQIHSKQHPCSFQTCDTSWFLMGVKQSGQELTGCLSQGSCGSMILLCHLMFPELSASPAPQKHLGMTSVLSLWPQFLTTESHVSSNGSFANLRILSLWVVSTQLSFSPVPFLKADRVTERKLSLRTTGDKTRKNTQQLSFSPFTNNSASHQSLVAQLLPSWYFLLTSAALPAHA